MNDLAVGLFWAALKVTALALLTAGLYAVGRRRGPQTAAPLVAVGLAGCCILTFVSLYPGLAEYLPTVSTPPFKTAQEAAAKDASPVSAGDIAAHDRAAAGPAIGWPGQWLRRFGERVASAASVAESAGRPWAVAGAGLLLSAAGLGLLRLAIGVWGLRTCLRRSQPVQDPDLLHMVAGLQKEIGWTAPVSVVESADLGTPATFGWRRPVVVLTADWRAWPLTERRAALAHELAHVARRDCLARLVAHLGVALHFYHPLLHWLAGRLHLEQELAADAVAARCSGGSRPYLAALAHLALRHAGRPAPGPVPSLFSPTGMLMRRIDMLRATNKESRKNQGRWTCRLLVGLVAAAGVCLLSPVEPGPKAAAGTPHDDGTAPVAAAQPEPFELSYLPPDTPCVLALRPAAVLRRPALARYTALVDLGLQAMPGQLGVHGVLRLSVADVEQVITRGSFSVDPKKKKNPHSLMFGLHTVRCVRDFDWKAQMKAFFPQAEEVHHAGGVYYRQPKSEKKPAKMAGLCYYIPDARTMVMDGEDHLRRLIENKGKKGPPLPWLDDWRKVDRGLIAVALDPRVALVKDAVKAMDPEEAEILPILENASWLAVGVEGADDAHIRAIAQCPGEPAAVKVLAAAQSLLEHGRKAAAEDSHGKDKALSSAFVRQLLQSAALERKQTRVEFRCEAREGFNALLQSALDLPDASVEAKPGATKR
jgi:beta-lactamase regulating signal transducer with metallopeptidase domain